MSAIKGNKNAIKHGMKGTRLYSIWVGMKTRCGNKNHAWFKHYGGRGITVCDRWKDFQNFMDDMHESYLQHLSIHGENNTTLDRVDGSQGYTKKNCRWATRKIQSTNARSTRFVTYNGETLSVSEWARKIGVSIPCLHQRLFLHNLPVEDALQKVRIGWRNKPRKKHI